MPEHTDGNKTEGLESSSDPVFRRIFREMGRAFVHRWSLPLIVLMAFVFGVASPHGIIEIDVHGTASSIFQVAGTMVALILPAAEMANNFISTLSDEYVSLVDKQTVPAEKKRRILTDAANTTRQHLFPAWRASVYVLCSFLLSVVAMSLKPISTRSFAVDTLIFSTDCNLSVDRLVLGASIGFLVIGSFWFFPTIWFAFNLKSIDHVLEGIGVLYPPETSVSPISHVEADQAGTSGTENHAANIPPGPPDNPT